MRCNSRKYSPRRKKAQLSYILKASTTSSNMLTTSSSDTNWYKLSSAGFSRALPIHISKTWRPLATDLLGSAQEHAFEYQLYPKKIPVPRCEKIFFVFGNEIKSKKKDWQQAVYLIKHEIKRLRTQSQNASLQTCRLSIHILMKWQIKYFFLIECVHACARVCLCTAFVKSHGEK